MGGSDGVCTGLVLVHGRAALPIAATTQVQVVVELPARP